MPPRKAKQQSSPLYIGFFGSGEASDENVENLLGDYLNSKGTLAEMDITFIIPAAKGRYTDPLQAVVKFAQDNDIPYEVIADEDSAKTRPIAAAIKNASKHHSVKDLGRKLVADLTKKDGERLLVAIWDDDDQELEKVANSMFDAEIPVRDITYDMEEVDFAPEDETAPEEAPAGKEAPADDAGAAAEGDDEPYTEEELNGFDLDGDSGLKAICEAWGIEVPPRSRKPTYVRLILEFQEQGAEDEAITPDEVTQGGGNPSTVIHNGPDADEIATAVLEALFGKDGPLEGMGEALDSMVEALETLTEKVDALAEEPEPEVEEEPEPEPTPRSNVRPIRRRI